ncbi:hypothetical protein GCM10022258_42940 [Aquimarina gracilis]
MIIIFMLLAVMAMHHFKMQQALKHENDAVRSTNEALQSKILALDKRDRMPDVNESLGYSRYLEFYKKDKSLVIELTMLDKGIVKFPIYCSVVNREYKDLLRFAVYKKKGETIKAYSGTHPGFGDIYKSILDIRKRFINKHLDNAGYKTLKANELIVQRIKGSGLYELDCLEKNIEIDISSLLEVKELTEILRILS